ncbi:MAG: DUF4375 domain-containing protein [Phycisphaeraceae bacterium]|nr:DUF4375 domain-containing protein [Phycisphaeraceae bacterium]
MNFAESEDAPHWEPWPPGTWVPGPGEPGWDRLTRAEQWLVAMSIIEGQVTSGGFHAVYYNSCDGCLPLAIEGYDAIGAAAQKELLEKVVAMMAADPWAGPPNTWPEPDAPERPEGSGDIGVFDEAWYRLDLRRLDQRKLVHVTAHPERFPRWVWVSE